MLIVGLSLHILSSTFWAGTSFTLARTGGLGGERLFRPQIGAAVVSVLTGAILWGITYGTAFGPSQKILALGAVCAIIAAVLQMVLGGRTIHALKKGLIEEAGALSLITKVQRPAAGLLAVTIISMALSRYV
jgi:hypothetical protein